MIRSFLAILKSGMQMLGVTAVGCVFAAGGLVQAQTPEAAPKPLTPSVLPEVLPAPKPAAAPPATGVAIFDPMVRPAAGCCTLPPVNPIHAYGGSNNRCVPGRRGCMGADSCQPGSRLFGGLCEALCCPDPCYEPRWIAEANAAFFQDGAKPVTQTRIRWDAGFNYRFPDTSEFFWGKIGTKGPATNTRALRYDDLTLYQEIAAGGASFFTEMPYRNYSPETGSSNSGLGDINLGTKAVLLDRELLLLTFQFRTFLPSGNSLAGAGTGHVSLEPALLAALKISSTTYLQTEIAQWIPIGGTPGTAGTVFHFHVSLNQTLCNIGDCIKVIGTLEGNGYTYRGRFTDFPSGADTAVNGGTFANAGGGLRLQICDRFDVGFGSAFGFGNLHGPGQLYRTELRVRY
ncbi:MAG: hypothetical protein EXS16_10160 [Gemmataceae bacterium]|nr:hypothetical protein [Gemmataceae bacterium]